MTYFEIKIKKLNKAVYPLEDITERIIGAKHFIESHYTEEIDLDTICKKACISKYHFIRLFKKYYGCTPHQYLKGLRVRKAKKLIQNGVTIRDACLLVGYKSVTSFSSLFKRKYGTAPSKIDKKAILDK
jgi:AraC-like DNA-binding protein